MKLMLTYFRFYFFASFYNLFSFRMTFMKLFQFVFQVFTRIEKVSFREPINFFFEWLQNQIHQISVNVIENM